MGNRYGLQIRAAIAADARGIADLLAAIGRPAETQALEGRIEAIRSGQGTLLLAEEWGPPSGLVALSWSNTIEADRPVARIDLLVVAPDDRRRGIARLLLKAGSQAARAAGCGELVLSVEDDAVGLDAFCRATGFEPSGRLFQRALRKRTETAGSGSTS